MLFTSFFSAKNAMSRALRRSIYAWAHPAGDAGPVRLAVVGSIWHARYAWRHPGNQKGIAYKVRALLRLTSFWARWHLLHQPTLARLGTRSVIRAEPSRWATLNIVCSNPPDYPEMLIWSHL